MLIEENIHEIQQGLSDNVKLIAVSKTRSVEEINEAYKAGVRDFGENKVQELVAKYDAFGNDVRWHLIGHLQRNKVKYIVGKVWLIHSLDSIELLKEVEKQYSKNNAIANVLIQINIGREDSKTGIKLEDLQGLIEECEKCSSVQVNGLMAIIPIGNEENCRNYFKEMKRIYDELSKKQYKNIIMDYLSMGMSSDYELAIEEGSNVIRVGEGIFGKRIYNNKQEEQ